MKTERGEKSNSACPRLLSELLGKARLKLGFIVLSPLFKISLNLKGEGKAERDIAVQLKANYLLSPAPRRVEKDWLLLTDIFTSC